MEPKLMEHVAKADENICIHSMGKRFRVRAIFTDDARANEFMEKHDLTAVIACFGPFIMIANCYEGIRSDEQ